MLGVFEHFIPNFNTFNKQKQLDIILDGFDKDNDVFLPPMFHYNMLSKTLLSKQKDSVHLPKLMVMFIPFHPPPSYPPLPTLAKNGNS